MNEPHGPLRDKCPRLPLIKAGAGLLTQSRELLRICQVQKTQHGLLHVDRLYFIYTVSKYCKN